MTNEEEEEVRSLLSRHRKRITTDLAKTNLIKILVENSVLNASQEKLFDSTDILNKNGENDKEEFSKNENDNINDNLCTEKKCSQLIDLISKNGFEKFKQFCYAIENECPELIEDLINDRLKYDTANLNTTINKKDDAVPEQIIKDDEDEDLKDFDRARRATSYNGTTTEIPVPAPRRASVSSLNLPQTNTLSPSPVISKLSDSNPVPERDLIINAYQSPSNYSSLLCHATSSASPAAARKKEKLLHRFSDAATLGRRLKKKKNTNRTCQSMTDAIEILGDQVVEDEFFADRTTWEFHTVPVSRVPGYGFGIAVSGGRDNPHFANGDPSIAISDVLKGGPAEDRLQVNDRIISVNGVSLDNVEYATAVQVLRDSGNTVTLVVKRRVSNMSSLHQHSHSMSSAGLVGSGGIPLNPNLSTPTSRSLPSQQVHEVQLTKASKKEDFGIVLGCRLFVKEISSKARDQLHASGYTLQEGDIITKIHNTNCNDTMSLKEAKKIIDSCKERLNLVVTRKIINQNGCITNNTLNNCGPHNTPYGHTTQLSSCSNNIDEAFLSGNNYSTQNLYVQPPTRGGNMMGHVAGVIGDEKSNLTPRGRSRGPLMDVSLSQLDRPSTPPGETSNRRSANPDEPPRPPPPRTDEFYSSRRQLYEDDPLQRSRQSAEPRFISFQKEGSVGIRLTGGNEAGIFVTAVQPGSPASLQGLTPGDKILKVNDMDMHGVTREEAVLFLLSLQDRIDLIVQHCKEEYEEAVANQRGDSFHIKTHFHCENPSKGEMAFKAGDVFRVIDTLHNGVVGAWQVLKIGRSHQEMQRGVIPNKARAEELATAQFNATKKEMNASESRGNFFRRRRSTHRRSKSLSRENWDDVVFSDSISKFPAYERVVLRHPGFVRPVVLFGPVADVAREKLIKDFPDKFTVPLQDDDKSNTKCRIVRLSNIRDIMDRGKHALLDITPNAVDRLNYAQFYPIVIFLKADTKHIIKQLRHDVPKSAHKSSKKLLEQCQKLDRVWSHIFSITIMLNDVDSWYRKLREAIDLQQSGAVWMSESKPVESLSDDFLFPMTTSRLSYASSPESDLELSPGPSASLSLGNLPQLVKSSSDPSIATNQDNLDRDRDIGEGLPPPYTHPYEHTSGIHNRRATMDSKYNFSPNDQNSTQIPPNTNSNRPQSIYGIHAPDLPPRVDRASKPPGGPPMPNAAATSTPPRNSSGGTIGRSAQERLFGKQLAEEAQDEYVTRNSVETADRAQSSLDRQRMGNAQSSPAINKVLPTNPQNGSYDSVSSYDSYNTTQLSVQNIRLGPNAPDDLKSVPNVNGRPPPPLTAGLNVMNESRNNITDAVTPNRSSLHEHSRAVHDHQGRNLTGTAGEMNHQNSPGRPPFMDVNSQRNLDGRNPPSSHDIRTLQGNLPQRPANLGIESSPRKQIVETKTDYGKYSRNNSTSQADYNKSPKTPHIGTPNTNNCVGVANTGNVGGAFKPVPPPKPKNYRPPVQGQMNSSGHWDNAESNSPRSPNGFFYPTNPSHYHQTQPSQGAPHGTPNNAANQPIHAYGHYNPGQAPPYPPPSNGYNGSGHGYSGQYAHRGHPSISNYPHHTPERHTLDLAGSREQRGSAFELYRKPQIGSTGHHHNMSEMEPYERYYDQSRYPQRSACYSNEINESRYYDYYTNENPPPLPPPLPQLKLKKKSVLKSPLSVLKNVFMKSTKPLRRMNSMVEPERNAKPTLRRQYSMMERHVTRPHYPPVQYVPMEAPIQRPNICHEPFYPRDLNNTYQNLEAEDIYGMNMQEEYQQQKQYCDNLYANRALIDLERREAEVRQGSRRIVRRHSMADRSNPNRQGYISAPSYDAEYAYKQEQLFTHDQRTTPGSAVMSRRRFYSDRADETVYHSRREMHRNHLYQSRREMQDRIAQGKREIEREFSPQSSSQSTDEKEDRSDRESIVSLSKREFRENNFRTKQSQLREQIYQSRREAIESMTEPIYASKKEVVKHEPIYETKEECLTVSKESVNNEEKENIDNSLNNNTSSDSRNSDVHKSDETVIEKVNATNPVTENANNEISFASTSVRSHRDPFHLSSIIKRTAPPPTINASRTSIETHYTSQASLPVGPPNATSTPYASEISLPANANSREPLNRVNEASTTRGVFDENGGTLRDNVWNVSLEIPSGAIPAGVKQEIYFTVTDPRMSETVGGPPLDMENGETMLSPLVMCGPQGLEFLVPVTLNIPHCAGRTASLGLALKATDSEHNLQTNWDNIDLPSNASAHTVSVKVDHF